MTMIFTLLPSESVRKDYLREIRDNFLFLRDNGSRKDSSYERIAEHINRILGMRLHKSDARRFLLGTYHLSRASSSGIMHLLNFSREEKRRLENTLSGVFSDVVVSIPVTISLVEAFKKCDGLADALGPEAAEKIRQAINKFKFDHEG